MNGLTEAAGLWLADVHLLAAALLAAVVLLQWVLRQPAQRLAVTKSTLTALAALAVLCALPGWSAVHLLSQAPVSALRAEEARHVAPLAQQLKLAIIPGSATQDHPAAVQDVGGIESFDEPTMIERLARLNWVTWLLTAHAAGSAALLAWLACGAVLAARIRGSASLAPPVVESDLRLIAGDGRLPELLISEQVETAAAMGLWQPRIVLAESLVADILPPMTDTADDDRWARSALASVLAHEWAHIRHGDLWTLAASRWLSVLFWPQPLFWVLRAWMRADQESLADSAAVEISGRVDYAEQLLGWARRAPSCRPHGLTPRLAAGVGLWEGPSQLKQRVAALLDERFTLLAACSRRWRVGSACLLLVAASLLSLVTWQPDRIQSAVAQAVAETTGELQRGAAVKPADAAQQSANTGATTARTKPEPNVVQGVCLDEHGAPLAGATVTLYRYTVNDDNERSDQEVIAERTTGADGAFRFDKAVNIEREFPRGLPDDRFPQHPIKALNVVLQAPGRATQASGGLSSWVARQGMSATMRLPKAATLRGRVIGPDGRPVPGATVTAGLGAGSTGMNTAKTDAEGRYAIDDLAEYDAAMARAEFEKSIRQEREAWVNRQQDGKAESTPLSLRAGPSMFVMVEHPEFATRRATVEKIPGEVDVSLEPSASIEGRVLVQKSPDAAPEAAAHARVVAVRDLDKSKNGEAPDPFAFQFAEVKVDAEGKYSITGLPTGTYHLQARLGGMTAMKTGVAALSSFAAKPGDIVLTPGGVVRFSLVADGKPMNLADGAKVYVLPQPRPAWPLGTSPLPNNVVVLSAGAKGEVRLPAGEYALHFSIPGEAGEGHWASDNMANPQAAPAVHVEEGGVVDTTIAMNRLEMTDVLTGTLQLAGPPADEAEEKETSAESNHFIPATAPADGPTPGAAASGRMKPEKFVRIVVGRDDAMTFEGARTSWDALPALLEKVPDREKTVLEIAIATNEMSVRDANNAQGVGFALASRFKFLYGSYIGVHPLGSKGGEEPAH